MTAVERQATPLSFMADRQVESPTSRFTAVNNGNGREATVASQNHVQGNGPPRRESVERQAGQPRVPTPGQEKLTITTQSSPKEDTTPAINGLTRSPPSTTANESESSHKRKRSGSQELPPLAGEPSHHGLPVPKDDKSPAISPDTPIEGNRVMPPPSTLRSAYSEQSTPVYSAPPQDASDYATAQWYARQSQEHAAANQPTAISDAQVREALMRETQGDHEEQLGYGTSPTDGSYQEGYVDNRSQSQIQQDDRKKRKRNFSNRTKTGCMTCRRRKKKCDEGRPECNNCIRGGFVCNGYPSRSSWTKPGAGEQKQAPVPLQSKEGYDPNAPPAPAGYGQPMPLYTHPGPQGKREPLPSYRGQHPPRVDTHQPPSHMGLDDRLGVNTLPVVHSPPDGRHGPGIAYSQPGQFPTPVSAHPNGFGAQSQHDFIQGPTRRPPFHDEERQHMELHTPQSAHMNTLPSINILNAPQNSAPHPLTQATSAQDAARLALSHPAARAATQKQNMLNEQKFFPYDKELVLERERCNAACWRFNTSTNPNNGVSPTERSRLFRDILQPNTNINLSATERSPMEPLNGRLGPEVVVEAPFTCDYGYNINIGSSVAIGKNCTILDTAKVIIGDRTIIGPNVSIYTTKLSTDPQKRVGSRGPQSGVQIVIEEDVWIGGGVTILPGIKVRKGSTIGAGSVVTRDVPAYTIVCGNPARVLHGVYHQGQEN